MKTCFIAGSKYTEFPFDYEKEFRYREELQEIARKTAQRLMAEEGCDRFIFLDSQGANVDFLTELFLMDKEIKIVIELFTLSKIEQWYFEFADKVHFISYKFPFFKKKRLRKYMLNLSDYVYVFYDGNSKKSEAYKTLVLSEKMNVKGDLYLLEELTDQNKLFRKIMKSLIEKHPEIFESAIKDFSSITEKSEV